MSVEKALAVDEIMNELANEVKNLRSSVEACKRYINEAHQKHDDLIATLDEIIRQQSEDLQADVQGIHDRLIENWPKKPYFMRRDY